MEGLRINRFDDQEFFVSPGNIAASIYFIQTGLIRGAIDGPKEKITSWIKKEGDIVIPNGLFNQQPSGEYIHSIAKTTLLSIPFTHIRKITDMFPEVGELVFLLILESVEEGLYRERLLRILKARDRYKHVLKHEDFIMKRISHYYIASYLNVTKETFSRLHKGLPY
jgi:CRP-like cAMP-binding protein